MKQENDSQADQFIEDLRDSGTKSNLMVSRLGFYRASEVDRHLASLQDQLSNAETMYMERFEELRSSLLAMTRERDEKIHAIRDLEKRLASAQDLPGLLAAQGLVGVTILEYEQQKRDIVVLTAEVSNLKSDYETLANEHSELSAQLKACEQQNPEQVQLGEEIIRLNALLHSKDDEISNLLTQAQQQRQAQSDLQTQLSAFNLQLHEQNEQSTQLRSQIQLLDKQHQIGQDMMNRLMLEKTALENDLRTQQQRFELQREALITRFQSVLSSQSQFLKKLSENFNASIAFMENLNETGLHGFNDTP